MINYYYIKEVGKSQWIYCLYWKWIICKSCSNLRLMYILICFLNFENFFQNLYSWYLVFLLSFMDKFFCKLLQMAIPKMALMDFNYLLFILVLMLTKVFSEFPWLIKISEYLYKQMICFKILINIFILNLNFNKIILY